MAEYTFVAGEKPTAATWNSRVRDQGNVICTSSTRPGSPVDGRLITETDTDKLLSYEGGAAAWLAVGKLGAFETYTPSWTATSAPSLGNGTITGRYQRLFGRIGIVSIVLTAGSSTTFGSGAWKFSLPSAWGPQVTYLHSGGGALDSSGSTLYDTRAVDAGSSTIFVYYAAVSGSTVQLAPITATVPVTWATSDVVHVSCITELTS